MGYVIESLGWNFLERRTGADVRLDSCTKGEDGGNRCIHRSGRASISSTPSDYRGSSQCMTASKWISATNLPDAPIPISNLDLVIRDQPIPLWSVLNLVVAKNREDMVSSAYQSRRI
jgi:hypothetical protein